MGALISRRGVGAYWLCALALLLLPARAAAAPVLGAQTRQLVVVTSAAWPATTGTLRRFERRRDGAWHAVGAEHAVALGEAGLGWGAGDDPARGRAPDEPRKREGDRRAPAGVFALEGAFGDGAPPPGTRLAYRAIADLICVDDPAAPDYNRVLPRGVARAHRSHETLAGVKDYALGVVVAHNRAPVRAGAGSCVFLHLGAPATPTVGCTAMPRDVLAELVAWLDPAAAPRLVQLPREVYRSRRGSWGLP